MSSWKVKLFGKFNIACEEKKIHGLEARKVQELLVYLLLCRNHPQPRELLSEVLWSSHSPDTSKKYLRQTLWRLQSALRVLDISLEQILLIDNNWIQLNLPANCWLDIEEFEKVFDLLKGKKTEELNAHDFELLKYATSVYRGDLLEGWYQDWCIFERERFQMMQLMLLDKIVQFCELHEEYEAGLIYGMEILRYDYTYERTHRQLMRLYFMTGNRIQSLHQYARCVTALHNELNVEPSERTKQLYEQIRLDTFRPRSSRLENFLPKTVESHLVLNDALNQLEQFAKTLRSIESRVQQEIVALESVLFNRS